MIIELEKPTFFLDKNNPSIISYKPENIENWDFIIVSEYNHGFPILKEGDILYRYKDRGYIRSYNKPSEIMGGIKPLQYEPKRNNRFLVEFPERFDIESWTICKINQPKFANGKWENIKVDFIDLINPSTSKRLFKIVNFLKTNDSDDKKLFEVKIKSLDPIGVVVEEWVIYIEDVLIINFGDLDYGDDEIQKPFLILKPLNCVLNF